MNTNSNYFSLEKINEVMSEYADCYNSQQELIGLYRNENDYSTLHLDFCDLKMACMPSPYTAAEVLEMVYHEIPDEQKCEVIFNVYKAANMFNSIPKKMLAEMKKYRPDYIIEPLWEIADANGNLTVYRGTIIPEAKPHLSASWTLSYETAKIYATDWVTSIAGKNYYGLANSFYLYQGVINLNDVLYYTDKSGTIIQHGSVNNINVENMMKEIV